MKQSRLIVVLLVLVVALAITAVLAFAQGAPVPQVPGFGPGMMGGGMMGRGQMGSGMMGQGWQGSQVGPGMMNGMGGMMGSFNLIDIVAEQLGVSKEQITRETSFVNDLGADSLDTVELVMELEEEFDINIPDDAAEKIQTVGQAIDYIEKTQS